ncbi:MAG: dienelactone hydrolase family protein [Thermoanaerobaculia bacterium]
MRRVMRAGAPVPGATGAVLLVHGRGASAEDILAVAGEIDRPDLAWVAPQAPGGSWYPLSFMAPREANEPSLSESLSALEELTVELLAAGVPSDRLALVGFSQGACLVLEHAYRHPRRYGAVAGLTGGLTGPPGTRWEGGGPELSGTPVLLSSGDPDPHVPWERVDETAEVLRGLGCEVDLRRHPGRPHTIVRDEVDAVGSQLDAMLRGDRG